MKKGIWIIIVASMILTSCANRLEKRAKNIEVKEKAPENLVVVMDGVEKLLVSADEIVKVSELTELEFQTQESAGKDNKESSNGKEQDQQEGKQKEGEKKDQNQANGVTKAQELFMKWKEVDKDIQKLHIDWNNYEIESIKKHATAEQGKKLKKELNSFTKAIESREISRIIDEGSKVINSLAPFFDLYKDEINGDLSRINYFIYQAYLKAENKNNKEADKLINEATEQAGRIKQKLDKEKDKDKTKNLDKLLLSISDIKSALDEDSIELLKIKRDIALKNIKALRD